MHLTEGRNTGFRKIVNALEHNGSPEPIFETDPERLSFCTTIFIHPQFLLSNGTKDGTKSGTKKVTPNCRTERVLLILTAIQENPQVTVRALVEDSPSNNALQYSNFIIEDGETGFKRVTVDTMDLSGPIELLATYSSSWSSGGSSGGGGGGGSWPTITPIPGGGKGTGSSVTAAGTVVTTVRGETRGGVLTMEVTSQAVEKLLSQNEDSLSDTRLITFRPRFTTRGSASTLIFPAEGLAAVSEKTAAGLRSDGPVADITITRETVQRLARQGDPIAINARREGQDTYSVSLTSGGQVLEDVPLYVELHGTCTFGTRAYLVKDNGEAELLPWAIADRSGGTMRILLPASGTVRLETSEQIAFKDVPQESWAAGPVNFVAGHGIFGGYEDGSFRPNVTMNRAMLVQILHRFAGSPNSVSAVRFTDVPSSAWCAQAVSWAAEQGIAGGYGDGQFGASRTVNRQDAVCFLYRYMGSPKADESILDKYLDGNTVGLHARQAVAWALENGVLTGETNETIAPTAQVTRYQAAKLMADLVQSQAVWSGGEKEA